MGLTVPLSVAVVVPTPVAVVVVTVGADTEIIVVGSVLVLLAGLISPPPETAAVLVTLAGDPAATLTVIVMAG